MDGTNITTTYGVYGGEKMSPLGNAKQADATNLHGPGNGLDSQPGATTGHSAKPPSEDPKAFIGGILRDDWSGVLRLKSLRRAGRLPFKKEEMSSKEILDMTAVLEYDPFGVEIFKLLVLGENPKIDLGRLSAEDSHVFADKLLEQGLGGMDLLEGLVREDRLPNILINKPKEFIDFCFSRGTSGLSLLQVFADKDKMSKFGPSEFSPEETKALADKLSDYDLLSRDSLAKLVKQGKFPPLAPLEDVPAHAFRVTPSVAPRVNPRQTLENAVKQAFFGKTDGIDDKSRADVRAKLSKMTWGEARGIWQTIANEMAVDCCDGDGNVDVERLRRWKEFLGNAENFRKGPFRFIPHTELMRSQMHRVCECLLDNQNGARDQLNAAKGITVGENGQDILKNISLGRQQSLCPGEAILASLLTPHRQLGLPTCTIHSLINAEIRNHPERLIKMYIQMLRDGQFTFPSGYAVQLQPMVGGSVTVDLRYGGAGRNRLFKDITDGDRAKIDQQIKDWKREGIEYVESTDETKKYKLKMPVYNMNDILFTHFCRASNFGNGKIDISEYGTMLVYAGNDEYSATTPVDGSKFLEGIAKLKTQAEDQKKLGHNYMRVVTQSSEGTHAENIDIDAILALDPNTMEPGKAYPIGDRNWYGDMSLDIPCLAVRKVDGTPPTYEFGTLCKESQFDNKNMTRIWVYGPDIEEHDAQYWARFKP